MELQALIQIVDRTDAQQLMLAAAGIRPAVRLLVPESGRMRLICDAIQTIRLNFLPGFDVVHSHSVPGRSGSSEWASLRAAGASDLDNPRYVYAGHDYNTLNRRCAASSVKC